MRKPSRILIGFILGFFLLISFACNFPLGDALLLTKEYSPTRTPRPTKNSGGGFFPTRVPKITITSEGFSPSETRPATDPLRIETRSYYPSMDNRPHDLGYRVTIKNPDRSYTIRNAIFQVTVRDTNGEVVGQKNHYVTVGPLEDTQIVSFFTVPDITKANSMGVKQINPGQAIPSLPGEDQIRVSRISYAKGYDSPMVTGEVTSTFIEDISGPFYTAVAYDTNGNIIGLGSQLSGPLPAGGTVPVAIPLDLSVEPAKVDLVFTPDGPTYFEPHSEFKLTVEKADVIPNTSGYSGGVVMILHNPDPTRMAMTAYYTAAAYDAAGNVLATCYGPVPGVLFPGERQGFGCQLFLSEESVPVRAEVFTLVSDAETPYNDIMTNPLTADNISLNVYKVTATIHNTLPRNLKYCYALIVAYDVSGKLAGQAFYHLDTMTAKESRQIEIGLYLGDTPVVRVEVFPVISSGTFW